MLKTALDRINRIFQDLQDYFIKVFGFNLVDPVLIL
jgi:hypothetical protein